MNNKISAKLVLISFLLIQTLMVPNNPAIADPLDSILTEAGCEVTIYPTSVMLSPGGGQQFTAETTCLGGGDPNEPVYTWDIMTQGCPGSTISATGLYIAPYSMVSCTDTVRAIDTANNNAEGTASVEIFTCTLSTTTTTAPLCCQIRVHPNPVYRSRWVMLPTPILIQNISPSNFFRAFESKVTYYPANAVIPMPRLVLNPHTIWQLVFVSPSWLAGGATDDILTVTVTTPYMHPSSGKTQIQMIPFGLDGKNVLK